MEFPDRDGARPIAWAIRFNNTAAVKMLLELKDRTSKPVVDRTQVIRNPLSHTLLHEACWLDREDIVALLLADVNADGTKSFAPLLETFSTSGMTPVHVAALRSKPPVLQKLHDAGANMDAATNNPKNLPEKPVDIAEKDGKTATADLLKALAVTTSSVMFAARMKGAPKKKSANRAVDSEQEETGAM